MTETLTQLHQRLKALIEAGEEATEGLRTQRLTLELHLCGKCDEQNPIVAAIIAKHTPAHDDCAFCAARAAIT